MLLSVCERSAVARAHSSFSTQSQSWSEGCSPDPVQCLATHLCHAKSKEVCVYSLLVTFARSVQ